MRSCNLYFRRNKCFVIEVSQDKEIKITKMPSEETPLKKNHRAGCVTRYVHCTERHAMTGLSQK